MKKYSLLLVIFLLFNSCKPNEMDNNCFNLNKANYEGKTKLLIYVENEKKRIESDGSTFYATNHTYESLPLILPLVSYWLSKNGYKSPSDEVFKTKVENFNIDKTLIQPDIENEFVEYKMYWGNNEGKMISDGSLFVSTKYKYILKIETTDMLVNVEDGQYYCCMNNSMLHLNKYIFNQDTTSLNWLIQNDVKLLEDLATYGGYDHDNRINKAVIDAAYKRYKNSKYEDKEDEIIYFFARNNMFTKEFEISKGLMQTIAETASIENQVFMRWLESMGDLINIQLSGYEPTSFSRYTNEEIYKLLCYICYYVELAYVESGMINPSPEWEYISILYLQIKFRPEFMKYLKANNYFDLPGYDKMVQTRLEDLQEEFKYLLDPELSEPDEQPEYRHLFE